MNSSTGQNNKGQGAKGQNTEDQNTDGQNQNIELYDAQIRSVIETYSFTRYGFTKLERPHSFAFYQEWIDQGYFGEMEYLKTHSPIKENPKLLLPQAMSAIVCLQNYAPHPEPNRTMQEFSPRVSLYAQGGDYHFWFKNKLKKLADDLKKLFPNEEFVVFTDSSPVLERDLAQKAGLGWIGKNSCLINPKIGSLFFIGEIYTSLDFNKKIELVHDFCGNCTKCIDSCPTSAIIEPKKLDATKCISYLTIESKKIPNSDLQNKMNDWFFGCDICQTVCPWNQKAFKAHSDVKLSTAKFSHSAAESNQLSQTHQNDELNKLNSDLKFILESSGKKLQKHFIGTPLMRAGPFGLKRNALIVIRNLKLIDLKESVEKIVDHEKLGDLARDTLKILVESTP